MKGQHPSNVVVGIEQPEKIGNFSSSSSTFECDVGDSYNPFEHRKVDKPNTTIGGLLHLLKCSFGTGILAMPNAMSNAGFVFGPIMTITIGILCTHCFWILVATSHKICRITKTPVLGFAETAEKVFEFGPQWARKYSKTAKNTVDYMLMATCYSSCCVYIVFIGSTFHKFFTEAFGWDINVRIYILIFTIPVLFIGQIRTLKLLVPFSGFGNAFILIAFGIVIYYVFNEPLVFDDKPAIVSWTQWPIFFSTVIFAMEGIGAVMPVENSMKKPQEFLGKPSVLLIAMSAITILYTVIGFLGFVRFGDKIEGSITLNLPKNEWPALSAQVFIGLAILFTFGLTFYIAMEILLKKIAKRLAKNRNVSEIVLRTGIMIAMGALAIAVPDLEPFIGLVGALFYSSLGIFIPALINTTFLQKYEGFGIFKWKLIKNVILMVFSFIAVFTGAFVSIKQIIEMYTDSNE